jgi:hypothetical protein
MKVHLLSNGSRIITLAAQPLRFSDGTVSEGQDRDVLEKLTLYRKFRKVSTVKGMHINETRMQMSDNQVQYLRELADDADIVILPFPILTALREQGIRDQFDNCVAFTVTRDTVRAPVEDKVIDINNWSY